MNIVTMPDAIQLTLTEIEHQLNIRVLFAVESGSRAWGFESKNSDYDIRGVYLSPLDRYLTILPGADTIESGQINALLPETKTLDLDFSFWDFRKFLALALKSNPAVFEWLASPIVYRDGGDFWKEVREAVMPFFSPKASLYHYISMAKHNYREHMRDGEADNVKLKKYLYICRPLLCARWVDLNGTPPPMAFEELLRTVTFSDDLGNELRLLLERKRNGEELDEGKAIPYLNKWIEDEFPIIRRTAENASVGKGEVGKLDELFDYAATFQESWL